MKTVYLAGPDVFLPDAQALATIKAAYCRQNGLEPLHPLDNNLSLSQFATKRDMAEAIMRANCDMMRKADGCIANLTPFHGPSADVGTAFEVGFMHALGKPVFGYSNVTEDLIVRVDDWRRSMTEEAHAFERARMIREDFGQFDNLMLPFALEFFTATDTAIVERYTDILTFQRAVKAAAERMGKA